MEKIILKNEKMICYFVADQQSAFYQSDCFLKIVRFIQTSSFKGQLKEVNHKLTLTIHDIPNVETADHVLQEILRYTECNL